MLYNNVEHVENILVKTVKKKPFTFLFYSICGLLNQIGMPLDIPPKNSRAASSCREMNKGSSRKGGIRIFQLQIRVWSFNIGTDNSIILVDPMVSS